VPQEWPPPLACKDGTHQWLSVCLYIYTTRFSMLIC
jgi:hypothetical protein